MCIYKKLQQARDIIKTSDLKKAGRNTYSNYDYYTPEQVDKLVYDACKEVGIINLFDLKRNEFGMYGELKLINLDNPEELIIFKQSSDVPKITATNVSQQIGGAVTFTQRYMNMTAFLIVDNNLDFDTDKKTTNKPVAKKEDLPIVWMSKEQFKEYIKSDAKTINNMLIGFNNKIATNKKGIKKKYCMKKEYATELKKQYELIMTKNK